MRVILDMDGVIVDWLRGIHRAMGWLPYDPKSVTNWDWYKERGATFEDIERCCTFEFWQGLPWLPDGQGLLGMIEVVVGPENIILASAPFNETNVAAWKGKQAWVYDHLGLEYLNRLIVTTMSKTILATGRDVMLIDDRVENCIDFRGAGGSAILVPAYHNCERDEYDNRVNIIREGLERWNHAKK